MNFDQFKKIFTVLYTEHNLRQAWLDKIPTEINAAFFDNDYTNSLSKVNTILLEQLLSDKAFILEDIDYFLYEFAKGGYIVTADGKEYKFESGHNVDDILNYFNDVYFGAE